MTGRAHAAVNALLVAPAACVLAAFVWRAAGAGPAALAGAGAAFGAAVLGTVAGPDMDIDSIDHNEWRLIKATLGLGFLYVALTYPYAAAVPHRSPWSHLPLVGTAGRALYFGLPMLVAALALRVDLAAVPASAWAFLAWALAGWAVADAAHWLCDGCPV